MHAVALAAILGGIAGSLVTIIAMTLMFSAKRIEDEERMDNEWGQE